MLDKFYPYLKMEPKFDSNEDIPSAYNQLSGDSDIYGSPYSPYKLNTTCLGSFQPHPSDLGRLEEGSTIQCEGAGITRLIEEKNKIKAAIDDVREIIKSIGEAESACLKRPAKDRDIDLLKEYSHRARLMTEELCKLTRKLDELTPQASTMKAAKLEEADDFYAKQCLFLTFAGPVDKTTNFMIPFESLPWAKALLKAVASRDSVLLHGHWQSGKTSALRYIETKAKDAGGVVYYIDMLGSIDTLREFSDRGDSFFQFLAWKINHFSPEYSRHKQQFSGADDFSDWVRETHKGAAQAPILLIDEYDAFLKFARRDPKMVTGMNSLIAQNRNSKSSFYSIVVAGTFSIVATQTTGNPPDVDIESDNTESEGRSSFDGVVEQVDYGSPWNKMNIIETQPFDRMIFKKFAATVYSSHNVVVSPEVVDDILQTTCGHPGFSVWLLSKSVQQAFEMKILVLVDWVASKRWNLSFELYKTPTMTKMMDRAKSSKNQISSFLHQLVMLYTAVCKDHRVAAFLRAVGVAKLFSEPNVLTFTSPIIRDCLLQQFYPPYGSIEQVAILPDPVPLYFMRSVLLKAVSFIQAQVILDPLLSYAKGLSEAAIHAEMYRILHSMFRHQCDVTIRTESRVVTSSDMRCDIWIKNSLVEFGVELKTECDTSIIQNPQILKYASVRKTREIVLLNFVRKEANSIVFPIKVQTAGWERNPHTCFSLIIVKVTGDKESGLRFSYALNGDSSWRELLPS